MPNIEMKATCSDLGKARATAKLLNGKFLWKDDQIDTYFFTKEGKLKLRESSTQAAELLPYLKVDDEGLKRSDYAKIQIDNPTLVKSLFDQLLGIRLQVRKHREVYLIGNIRVHLDKVENLGAFLEFEAVFEDDTPENVKSEKTKVLALMKRFEVERSHLLDTSYPDLLAARN